jgi:hypothetical protein
MLVALFVVLICARMPDVILHGRFWAEEGRDFFRYAWENPWYRALARPYGGYLNLVANGGTLLAHVLVPLKYAPYVTIAIALFFQACPAIMIITGKAAWLRPRWAVLAALFVLATPPVSEEVWLQTLHSQFHLALCAGIILTMQTEAPRWLRWFRIALLALAPLCGPAAIVFVPFFALRATLERTVERWMQTAALAISSALQLGLFYSAQGGRSYHIAPDVLASVLFIRHLLIPLFGRHGAGFLSAQVLAAYNAGKVPWLIVASSVAVFAAWIVAALWRWREAPAWLLIPGLTLAAVSYYGALDGGANLLHIDFGCRYSFVPQALFGLSLLAFATTRHGVVRWIATAGIVWIISTGLLEYFKPSPSYAHGPDWANEIAVWQANPAYHPAVWPPFVADWQIDLSKPWR